MTADSAVQGIREVDPEGSICIRLNIKRFDHIKNYLIYTFVCPVIIMEVKMRNIDGILMLNNDYNSI